MMCMIKKIAWETFKHTGDINTFLELKQIEGIEQRIEQGTNIQDIQNIQKITNVNLEDQK